MRFSPGLIAVLTVSVSSPMRAQSSVYELQAGIGYARLFDAGGISLTAAVDRALSRADAGLRHTLGGLFWYTHTGIASVPNDPEGRHTLGLGARYQLSLAGARSLRPFLAVPLQLLHSDIPDRPQLTADAAALLVQAVPEAEPPLPIEDRVGGNWGWGTGLELGVRLQIGERLSGQTSVQGLYQNIYEGSSSHDAWTWHAGISYGL
jgi:hypothetical protein